MLTSAELSAISALLSSAQLACDFSPVRDFEIGVNPERMSRYSHLIARVLADKKGLSDEVVDILCCTPHCMTLARSIFS